jgi:hypothetical protein
MTVATALLALAAIASSNSPPRDTTVCAVLKNPPSFNEKIVRFRATVLTDWHHGIALIQSGCQGAIQLGSVDAVPPKQSRDFDEAVGTRLNPGVDRAATATFTGRILWRPRAERGWFDNPLKLEALLIEDVKTAPREQHR